MAGDWIPVEGGEGVTQANPCRESLSADNESIVNLYFQEKLLRLID